MAFPFDALFFTPDDVDLSRSPLRRSLTAETYVLGAFNPGLTRLPSGNLLAMVRVAEALREPVVGGRVHAIRWTADGYRLEGWPVAETDSEDPRQFVLKRPGARLQGLTSISWLLPVELSPDGRERVAIHYDRAIEPRTSYQDYGVEDARISRVDGRWWMTVCSVSAERLGTSLYTSDDGLDWRLEGLILDHLNKDMLLFEGKVGGMFMALTRPLGDGYFAFPEDSPYLGGPSINMARSPDGLHWKPTEEGGIRGRRGHASSKVGGGTPPILTHAGWLTLFHGVEVQGKVGVYRTFWAVFDREDPTRLLRLEDERPVMESLAELIAPIAHQHYLPTPVVFTTGLVDGGPDHYIVASGEADLACRLTWLPKGLFA